MSNKANPTVIGAFVLGAIALTVSAVAIFGSGKLFKQHPRAVAFFQGNIQGLNVGSAVNIRGVEIGSVTGIQLRLDVKTMAPITRSTWNSIHGGWPQILSNLKWPPKEFGK